MKIPNSPDNFAERLRFWRVSQSFTQAEAARQLDIDRSYLSQIERGRAPGTSLRTRFLLVEKSTTRITTNPGATESGTVQLPLLNWSQAASLQHSGESIREWDEVLPSSTTDDRAFAVRIRGDAMEPKFFDLDIAVILRHETPANGDIILANVKSDGLFCRILHTQQDRPTLRLSAYNPAYLPLEYRREEVLWIHPIAMIIRHLRRK